MENDGYSLDDKRNEIKENDIPDIIDRFNHLDKEADRARTEKSFLVDKSEIVENDYVFSFNKYQKKEIVKKTYRPTNEIISSIKDLENQFAEIMKEIEKGL